MKMKKENTRIIHDNPFSNKVLDQKKKDLKLNDRSIKSLQSNFLVPDPIDPSKSRKLEVISYNFSECKGSLARV